MSIFDLTSTDIQNKLAPVSGDSIFSIGSEPEDSLTSADCQAILETQEKRVMSLLPVRHRRLVEGDIQGEVLARHSEPGQTGYSLSFAPVASGSLSVYLDFPSGVAWADRQPYHRLNEGWSLNAETGALTFQEAPTDGTQILAEYRHSNQAAFGWVKECVLSFAAAEIARRFSFFRDATGQERFETWEAQALAALRDVKTTSYMGVEAADSIQLLEDIRPDTYRVLFYE